VIRQPDRAAPSDAYVCDLDGKIVTGPFDRGAYSLSPDRRGWEAGLTGPRLVSGLLIARQRLAPDPIGPIARNFDDQLQDHASHRRRGDSVGGEEFGRAAHAQVRRVLAEQRAWNRCVVKVGDKIDDPAF
jgi:hypothetical protein